MEKFAGPRRTPAQDLLARSLIVRHSWALGGDIKGELPGFPFHTTTLPLHLIYTSSTSSTLQAPPLHLPPLHLHLTSSTFPLHEPEFTMKNFEVYNNQNETFNVTIYQNWVDETSHSTPREMKLRAKDEVHGRLHRDRGFGCVMIYVDNLQVYFR